MRDDVLKVIELAKLGKCTPEQWESLPVEIRQRILEIRVDVRVPPVIYVNHNHNVKVHVPKPAELGFKAGFGWTIGKGIANLIGCCGLLFVLALIALAIAIYASGH